ncbi:MAG: hypothetical protein ACYTEQ_23190, partial [Planctomycetota bacterium]
MKRIVLLAVMSMAFGSVNCTGAVKAAAGRVDADDIAAGLSDTNAPATLEDYLRYAALNNAGLKAAFEEWKAALQQVTQSRALPDPRFTYSYFIE